MLTRATCAPGIGVRQRPRCDPGAFGRRLRGRCRLVGPRRQRLGRRAQLLRLAARLGGAPGGPPLGGERAHVGVADGAAQLTLTRRDPAQILGEATRALGERCLEPARRVQPQPSMFHRALPRPRPAARAAPALRAARCAGVRPERTGSGCVGPRACDARRARRPRQPVRQALDTRRAARGGGRRARAGRPRRSRPANHSSPRCGSQPIPSAVTAGTGEASRSSRSTTGQVDELLRITADEHEQRAEPR